VEGITSRHTQFKKRIGLESYKKREAYMGIGGERGVLPLYVPMF